MAKDEQKSGFSTRTIEATRSHDSTFATALPPVYHASTVFFDTLAAQRDAGQGATRGDRGISSYGTVGTPTTFALADALATIEGAGHACRAAILPSGLNAISCVLQALLSAGDHLLMSDAVYGPARLYANSDLARFGVETEYFAADATPVEIAALFRPNTRLIYMENPSTQTFELLDVGAIAAEARQRGILTLVDNAWASPMFSQPFDWGVDISLLPLTKYWCGHSDVVLGAIIMRDGIWDRVWPTIRATGPCVSGDACALVLRSARTAELRMLRHQESALRIARWLEGKPGIRRVLHPALESHPQHDLWQRDFSGSSGLFAIELEPSGDDATDARKVAAFCEGRRHFRIGASWGGVDSIALPVSLQGFRTKKPWTGGPVIRLSIGLENVEDLIADLAQAISASTPPAVGAY